MTKKLPWLYSIKNLIKMLHEIFKSVKMSSKSDQSSSFLSVLGYYYKTNKLK